MAITFRHDAAAVVPPSNESTRKYGQQLVQQEQKRKYDAQQAGYDRMFTLGRDNIQNEFQAERQRIQNVVQMGMDAAQNDFQVGRDKRQQQAADFAAARSRIDTHAKDMLASGQIKDPETRNKIQNLIAGKTVVMGSGFDETARQNYLDQYNAELAKILSEVPTPPTPPTRDEQLKEFLGPNYDTYKDQPWVPDGKGGFVVSKEALEQQQREQERQQQEAEKLRPQSFGDYYNHPDNKGQFQKDLDATMTALEEARDPKLNPQPITKQDALKKMQEDYDFTQKVLGKPQYGEPTQAPTLPGAATPQPATGEQRSILETPAAPPPAAPQDMTVTPPDAGIPPSPQAPTGGQPATQPPATADGQQSYDAGVSASHDADMTAKGYKLVTPPDGSRPYYYKEQKQPLPLTSNSSSQNPASADIRQPVPEPQQVNVGGKPLAVTPGTLTPQETAFRQQVMEMPREQRIATLMPYDSELKGRTLEQLLEDPKTKAGYAEMTKKGLTTGNYREDMLGHIDDMLQYNVLQGAGQSKPDAYVGMRADEITDPKAKAEVAKMPRPKTAEDMKTIRSRYFVDPNGVIRSTQKQA